jgi:SAM-dependent methyltransferase
VLRRLREWRIDRMTDRIARRPHGRTARAVYGAPDVHAFVWEPVLAALALEPSDRLLDVGCGGGVFLRRALETAGCTGTGLDHSREMVKLARELSGAPVVQAEAEELPFGEGEFTAISCLIAFFFFADPLRVLREFRRVLVPERGRIAVVTTPPEARGTPAAPYPLATRGRFYGDDELERLPLEAGFGSSAVTRTDIGAQLLVARP